VGFGFACLALSAGLWCGEAVWRRPRFPVFCWAAPAAAWQITVFFSKAKTAVIIGLVLLFASVFPDIAVEGSAVSTTAKARGGLRGRAAPAHCTHPHLCMQRSFPGCVARSLPVHKPMVDRARMCLGPSSPFWQSLASILPATAFALALTRIGQYENLRVVRVGLAPPDAARGWRRSRLSASLCPV
jgi:hypothetical protein